MSESPADKFKLIADSLLLDVGITGDEVYEPIEENFMDEEELQRVHDNIESYI